MRGLGVADDREVLKVGLRLRDELLPLGASDRREGTLAHCGRTITESLQHRVEVQRIGHDPNRTYRWPLDGACTFIVVEPSRAPDGSASSTASTAR